MTARSSFAKREKSLAEQVIIVLMIGALMASFVYYFFKEESEIKQVGFANIASQFSSKITAIKAQWYMDKQPNVVTIKTVDDAEDTIAVEVNKSGWVNPTTEDNACQMVWQWVMQSPMFFMKHPVSAYLVTDNMHNRESHCRFSLPSGKFFEYWPKTGKVSQVKHMN